MAAWIASWLVLAAAIVSGGDPAAIRITSPLGRTGLVGRVRIVAQVHVPDGATAGTVRFFVDDVLVGTCADPPFAVDWTDENPFEAREIVAELDRGPEGTVRDTVVLPAFEIRHKTEVTSVLLEAAVYGANGRFVSDLDGGAFVVRENGVVQPLDLVSRETMATRIALLVDSSRSMIRRMPFVRTAAERLTHAARAGDELLVVPFTTQLGAVTGPSDDRTTIGEAIAAIRSAGGTAIFDSVIASAPLLDGVDGRRAMVVVSDGYDEHSTATVDQAIAAAQAVSATVYVVAIGGVAGVSFDGERTLGRLAAQTGGRLFVPPRDADLPAIADAIAADAHSRYLIAFTPLDQRKDGTWRPLTVEVPSGCRVRTRAGYFAPDPPPVRATLEFAVTNQWHEYVDLTSADVDVYEDGVPQTVDTFQEAVDPVSIVMALDASGSMKPSAEPVQRAARDFVLAVKPEDRLALITFADKPTFAHTLADNRQWTLDAIAKYVALGGTALYDALYNSLLHLRDTPGRRAVVVLTDGRDENNPGTAPGSVHTLEEVMTLRRQVGAVVFPIGIGTKVERPVLERLARESGGEAYFPADASAVDQPFRRIVENLRRRWLLGYTSTNSSEDRGWRTVEIKPRAAGLEIASPGGYFPPDR